MPISSPQSAKQARAPIARLRQRGFTLIEVMIASTFLVITLNAIFSLQAASAGFMQSAANYDRASSILLDVSETMQVLTPARLRTFIDQGPGQAFTRSGSLTPTTAADAFFVVSATLIPTAQAYAQVDVKVTWAEKAGALPRQTASSVLVKLQ